MNRRTFLSTGLGAALLGITGCLANPLPSPLVPDPLPTDPTLRWLRRYGRANSHESFDVLLPLADGGFFAAGAQMRTGDAAFLVRTTRDGEERWHRLIDGPHAVAAVETADGGVLLVVGPEAPRLIALDTDGGTVWSRIVRPTSTARYEFTDIETALDGGFVLAGTRIDPVESSTDGGPTERRSAVVVAVDPEGHVRWERLFPAPDYAWATDDDGNVKWGPGSERANAIVAADDGYLLLCEDTDTAPYVRRLAADGTERWRRSYGAEYNQSLWAVAPRDGGYVLAGRRLIDDEDYVDVPWLLAIDTEGSPVWSYGYQFGEGQSSEAGVSDLVVDPDGSVVLAGSYHPDGRWTGRSSPMLVGIGADGTLEWSRRYGDRGGIGSAVVRAPDGSCVLAGQLDEAGPWTDAVLVNAGRPTGSNIDSIERVSVRAE